jgi:hypothetical protein
VSRPLVLTAPRRVTDAAARLGLARCLERVVEETFPSALKLEGGRLRLHVDAEGRRNGLGRPAVFAIELERARSSFGRRAWRPTGIERVR